MNDQEKKVALSLVSALGNMPSNASIPDAVSYFYIKKIKGWMECPVCGEKLLFADVSKAWVCEDCGFVLPEDEFLDGYVFCFCDECESFLNVQEGFNPNCDQWICSECGFNNDITENNLKGTCQDCGALLDCPDATVCDDCEATRLEAIATALE